MTLTLRRLPRRVASRRIERFQQQGKVTMSRYSLVLLVGLASAAVAPAASWADAMFEEHAKDFGSVPRGPMLTHPFHLTNTTKYNVHITSVRVSCGCTSATAMSDTLAPGQATAVVAQMDTTRFIGHKAVTIFVQFDQPAWEEAQLVVRANSRDDLSITPDSLAFGQVSHGTSPRATVVVSLLGDSGWQIQSAHCDSNYVHMSLSPAQQTDGGIQYQLTAQIRPDTPIGHWYTDVWLTTNNPDSLRVRVPLTIEIQPPLTITARVITLGQIKAGGTAERRVIVHGTQPFVINAIRGTDKLVHVQDTSPGRKSVHLLTVTVKSPAPGAFNRPITINRSVRVITDLPDDNAVGFEADAVIQP